MVTAVLVDDHPIVLAGMRAVLDTDPTITVVAQGATGRAALELTQKHRPDVLVLDVNLPDIDGVEVTRHLRARRCETAILILTALSGTQIVFDLLENGATGYVLKDEALEVLPRAVHAAAQGESWLSPSVASKVVQRAMRKTMNASRREENAMARLTLREIEVLKLIAQGLDNTAIAQRLVITKRTVQNHISNIYGKLGIQSRAEAILLAMSYWPNEGQK